MKRMIAFILVMSMLLQNALTVFAVETDNGQAATAQAVIQTNENAFDEETHDAMKMVKEIAVFAETEYETMIGNEYIEFLVYGGSGDGAGRFTMGTVEGNPKYTSDNNTLLLYGHPGSTTSYTTIRVNGTNYIFQAEKTIYDSDSKTAVSTMNIGQIQVKQILQLVASSSTGRKDTVQVRYDVINNSSTAQNVGIRIMMDTMLGSNDGAPFKVPSVGNVTHELELIGNQIPTQWQVFDNLDAPSVFGIGTLYRGNDVKPDKVQFAYWGDIYSSENCWDYTVSSDKGVTGDSAIGIYWNPKNIQSGKTLTVSTYYGVGQMDLAVSAETVQVPAEGFSVMALDEDGNAMEGVTVTASNISGTPQQVTDESGVAVFSTVPTPAQENQKVTLTLSKDGYYTMTNVTREVQKGGSAAVVMYPDDGKPHITAATGTMDGVTTDLLYYTKYFKSNPDSVKEAEDGSNVKKFQFHISAISDVQISRYQLIQSGKVVVDSNVSNFTLSVLTGTPAKPDKFDNELRIDKLDAGKNVYLRVIDENGNASKNIQLGLKVSEPSSYGFTDTKGSLKFGEEFVLTLPSDIPILGGAEFTLGWNALPFEFEVTEDGKVKFAVNMEVPAYSGGAVDGTSLKNWDQVKKNYSDAMEQVGLGRALSGKAFGAKPQKFGAGCIDVDFDIMGYGEGFVDDDGNFTVNLGIVLELSEKGSFTKTFFLGYVPVYISVGEKVACKGTGQFSVVASDGSLAITGGVGEINPSITLNIDGGVGVNGVLNVGASGRGTIDFLRRWSDGYRRANLSLSAYIVGTAFLFKAEKKFAEKTWTLYDDYYHQSVQTLTAGLDASFYDSASYQPVERYYLDVPALMYQDSSVVLQTVYPDASPRLVQVGDTAYLFWLNDNGTRGDNDRTALVYSTSTDLASWSEPVQIIPESETSTADFSYDVCVDGDVIHIAISKANCVFADQEVTIDDLAASAEIYYVALDTGDATLSEAVRLTENSYSDTMPAVTADNGQVQIAYVCNQMEGGLFGTDNTYSICRSTVGGETGTQSVNGLVTGVYSGSIGGETVVAYIVDTDCNFNTSDDMELWLWSGSQNQKVSEKSTGAAKAAFARMGSTDVLLWYAEGNIHYLAALNGEVTTVFEDGACAVGSNFSVLQDQDGTFKLVWETMSQVNETGTTVYAVACEANGWSAAHVLYESDNELAAVLCGYGDGEADYVAYLKTFGVSEDYPLKSLCVETVTPDSDLELLAVDYDMDAVARGEVLPMSLTVTNNGAAVVETITVTENGEQLCVIEDAQLGCGETKTFEIDQYVVPADLSGVMAFDVDVACDNDINPTNNSKTVEIGYVDVAVDSEAVLVNGQTWLNIVVSNSSFMETDVTLRVIADEMDGAILYEQDIYGLTNASTESVMLNLSELDRQNSVDVCYVVVTPSESELASGNNTDMLYLALGREYVYFLSVEAGDGGVITGIAGGDYSEGTAVEISAEPAKGFLFDYWESDNGGVFENAAEASTVFTMPSNDTAVRAVFKVYQHDHVFTNYYVESEATCTAEQVLCAECDYCTALQRKTVEGSMEDHLYEDYYCVNCGIGSPELTLSSGECGDGLTYILNGAGVLTISGEGSMAAYESEYDVPWHDYRGDIRQVVLGSGAVNISAYAFYNCTELKSVEIPETVTEIGTYAFAGCYNLEKVEIPAGVAVIGESTFMNCSAMASVEIPQSVTRIENYAFYNCDALTGIVFPSNLESIGDCAFESCENLLSVTLPESLSSLGSYAFRWCESLDKIVFLGECPETGDYVFDYIAAVVYYPMENTTWAEAIRSNSFGGTLSWRTRDPETGVVYRGAGTCGDDLTWKLTEAGMLTISGTGDMWDFIDEVSPWYSDSAVVRKIVVEEGVTGIGSCAFLDMYNLFALTLPEGITRIGDYAFQACGKLNELVLPESLTHIGQHAFNNCCELTELRIPAAVEYVGPYAFAYCRALEKAVFLGDAPEDCQDMFYDTKITAYYPAYNATWTNGVLQSNWGDVTWYSRHPATGEEVLGANMCGDNLRWILEKDGTLTIFGSGSMWDNDDSGFTSFWSLHAEQIRKVVFSGEITSIGRYAFQGCTMVETLELPETLEQIGSCAFYYCSGLKTVTVPAGVEQLGAYAFYGCDSLEWVRFLGDAPAVDGDDQPFYGVNTQIIYPAFNSTWNDLDKSSYGYDLQWRGFDADTEKFYYGTGSAGEGIAWTLDYDGLLILSGTGDVLTDENGNVPWNAYKDKITKIVVEEGITSLPTYAFSSCTNLVDAALPETLTELPDYAFAYCYALTGIELPDGLTAIGEYAFYNAGKLQQITIPAGVERIGYEAFYYCGELETITFLGNAPEIGWDAFYSATATAYYPALNDTWTSQVLRSSYGGDLTWKTRNPVTGDELWGMSRCGDSAVWVLGMNGVLTVSGSGAVTTDVNGEIPWDVYKSKIIKVVVEEGITSLPNYAFSGCDSLVDASLPETLTELPEYAFANCHALTGVELPDTLTVIGDHAFQYASKLQEITIPATVERIGYEAFYYCGELETITFLGDAPEFGWDAFYSVTATAYYPAMNGTWNSQNLNSSYGGNLTWKTRNPETGTDLWGMGSCGENASWVLDLDGVLTVSGSGAVTTNAIGEIPWQVCKNKIVKVVVEEGITSLPNNVFDGCTNLVEVSLPETLTELPEYAFAYCYALTGITLPDTLTVIGDHAFQYASALQEITIPAAVERVGYCSFYYCGELKTITFLGDAPEIGYDAFYSATATAYYPAMNGTWTSQTLNSSYGGDLTWKTRDPETGAELWGMGSCGVNASWVLDLDGVLTVSGSGVVTTNANEEIPWEACKNKIIKVVVKEGITSLPNNAFSSCTSLVDATLPETLTELPEYAFAYCYALTGVELPTGLTVIGDYAFYDASGLKEITIPAGVERICYDAFGYCGNLETITFLGDASEMEWGVFYNVTATAYYPAMNDTWTAQVLNNSYEGDLTWKTRDPETGAELWGMGSCGDNLTWVMDLDGVLTIYGDGQMWNFEGHDNVPWSFCRDEIKEVRFEGNPTSIGNFALNILHNVTRIDLPDSVTRIGDYAFYYCSALEEITLPDALTEISEGAFQNCDALERMTIPGNIETIGTCAISYCGSLRQIEFTGSCPEIAYDAFNGTRATVYYPAMRAAWTNQPGMLGNYGGNLRWRTVAPQSEIVLLGMGFCGTRLTWTLELDGTLTISGTGAMRSWEMDSAPWSALRDSIVSVRIADGVTSIADYAFAYCYNLYTVSIADTVDMVGKEAFYDCYNLSDISFCGDAPLFDENTFNGMNNVIGYYPVENDTWTQEIRQSHGNVLWVDYTPVVHSWVDATCTSAKTCSACGMTEGIALGHAWDDGTVITAATCNQAGEIRYGCTAEGCAATKTEEIAVSLVHSWVAATCTSAKTCSVCGATTGTVLGHAWDNGTTVKPATCTEAGEMKYTCTADGCGATRTEEIATNGTHTAGAYTQENLVDKGTYYDYDIVVRCAKCSEVLSSEKPINPFGGAAADLGNSLSLKFGVNCSKLTGTNNYAVITRFYADGSSDVSDPIYQSEWPKYSNTLNVVVYEGIAGKEMTDMMQVQIFDAEGKPVSVIWKDSIRSYTMRMLDSTIAKYQKSPTTKLKNQITAMVELLNYGAAAQNKFGYNTGDLANSQLTEAHLSYAIADQTAENVFQRDTAYSAGVTMILESRLKLGFGFYKAKLDNVAYAIVSHKSHVDGSVVETRYEVSEFEEYTSTVAMVPVTTVSAADGDQVITCTLYDANGNVVTTASDTMNSYLSRMSSKDPLFQAVMKYTRACYANFHP